MWYGHMGTKSDRWVSSGYPGFLTHENHRNENIGANEHSYYKLYNLFRNRCKLNKVYINHFNSIFVLNIINALVG